MYVCNYVCMYVILNVFAHKCTYIHVLGEYPVLQHEAINIALKKVNTQLQTTHRQI